MSKKLTQNRSAVTGQFVTAKYAKANPKTTVTERNRSGQPKRRGK